MTKQDCKKILELLARIKDPDARVDECKAILHKQMAVYAKFKGQLRDTYEYDY